MTSRVRPEQSNLRTYLGRYRFLRPRTIPHLLGAFSAHRWPFSGKGKGARHPGLPGPAVPLLKETPFPFGFEAQGGVECHLEPRAFVNPRFTPAGGGAQDGARGRTGGRAD